MRKEKLREEREREGKMREERKRNREEKKRGERERKRERQRAGKVIEKEKEEEGGKKEGEVMSKKGMGVYRCQSEHSIGYHIPPIPVCRIEILVSVQHRNRSA